MDLGFFEFLLIIIGGFGAGIVTGLAGASAATIITPLLTTFTLVPAYSAVTLALFTDVSASAASANTYKKNGNIDMKNGVYLSIFAMIGAAAGSILSSYFNETLLSVISSLATFAIGINFYRKSLNKKKYYDNPELVEPEPQVMFKDHQKLASVFLGIIIGLVCGIIGAGGGLLILLILTTVLGYDTKTAVGTSVLIMVFTALVGGVTHLANVDVQSWSLFVIAIVLSSIFGIIGAKIAARFANLAPEYKMLKIVSLIFLILSGTALIQKLIALLG